MTRNLDLDDLNFTAARLAVSVMNKIKFIPLKDRQKNRVVCLSKISSFLQEDVACDLQTTACLMEDILKEPLDIKNPLIFVNHFDPEDLDRSLEFNVLLAQINFEPRTSARPSDLIHYDKQRIVFNELQNCLEAAANKQPYTPSALCDNMLSSTADHINSSAFVNIYHQFLDTFKTLGVLDFNSNFTETYLDRVFEQTRECQNALNTQILFSQQVEKRRQHTEPNAPILKM